MREIVVAVVSTGGGTGCDGFDQARGTAPAETALIGAIPRLTAPTATAGDIRHR